MAAGKAQYETLRQGVCAAFGVDAEDDTALLDVLQQLAEALRAPPDRSPRRRHLPDERASRTVTVSVAGNALDVTVGMYEDGMPGEIFVRAVGSWDPTARSLLDQWAIAVSIALQWGADGPNLFNKFANQRFAPEGPASPNLGLASSPIDAIARWVLRTFYQQGLGEHDA